MSQGTPTNGRVTNAILLTRLDHVADVQLVQTAQQEAMRSELSEMRQMMAVNEERWRNHDKANEARWENHWTTDATRWDSHGLEHARENRIITAISATFSAASGYISALISR